MAMSYMDSQWPVRKSLQGDMQGLYDIDNELPVRNGLLYRSDQLVVQKSLRPNVTQHRERMLRGGTSLCSMLNIKGDITKFSKISVKTSFINFLCRIQ